jgi:vacuolar-type H+-ATPase subunit I/STV1
LVFAFAFPFGCALFPSPLLFPFVFGAALAFAPHFALHFALGTAFWTNLRNEGERTAGKSKKVKHQQ